MATNKKDTMNGNDHTNGDGARNGNGHVSLAREEYEAFTAREEIIATMTIEQAKIVNRNADLVEVCEAQLKRMSGYELKTSSLERITGLQSALIELLRDKTKVATLEDFSEFWRQWIIHTERDIDGRKVTREEVAKFEPDLFKMWRNWVNDQGKQGRTLNWAGTRAEIEDSAPKTPREMQEHMIRRLREENAKLSTKVMQLESEIIPLKAVAKAP